MRKLINQSSTGQIPPSDGIVPDISGSHPQVPLSHNGGNLEADADHSYIQLEDGPPTEDKWADLLRIANESKVNVKPYTIQAITPLSWSGTSIKEVKYNKLIAELMSKDTAFTNWIKTCIMVHSESGQFETVCRVPDLWASSIEQINIVTAGKSFDRDRLLEALPGQYIHCMIGVNKNIHD